MKETILGLIKQGRYSDARQITTELNVVDAAHLFEEMDPQHLLIVFRILPKDFSSDVFTHMPSELQETVINSMTDEEAIRIFDDLFLDDAVDFLEEMPSNVVKRILENSTEDSRRLINQFLNYPEDSAGSLMTIEYVGLKKEMSVRQALQYIKDNGVDKRTINTCYVMDGSRVLEGVIPLRKLVLSDESAVVADLMDTDYISIKTHDDQEEVAALFQKYDYYIMPVVDNENRLVGIITVDDILDVMEEEATEDLQKMAAMQPSEKEYLKTSNWELARNRLPWLLLLMIGATFTGGIIKRYESALQSVLILASFIPMIMDTGGNSGSQSSTLVIRGLAVGEIQTRDASKVMGKEFAVSGIVGLVLALVNFLRIYLLEGTNVLIALTVSITLFFTVVLAKIVGSILPIIAKKLKLDPAIMAGPLITTIVDAAALLVYFSVATVLLGL